MNKEELSKLIKMAHGDIKADLVIKHVNLVNVFTAEIQEDVDIAISGKWIAGVGSYEGEKEISGHVGLRNLRQRLSLLYGEKGTLTLTQLTPDRILAKVTFPIES